MTKTYHKIYLEDGLWEQFQMLFPRQASNIVEETLLMMINQKIEKVGDDAELQDLMNEAADKKKALQEISGNLQNVHARIQQYQMEKRKELAEKERQRKIRAVKIKSTNDAIRASGILRRVNVV